jgi:molybdopterin synthase catalytic subunit
MIELTEQPIDSNRLLEAVSDPNCGGQVLFVGTTRQWTKQVSTAPKAEASSSNEPSVEVLETDYLMYEAYQEMALRQMQELASEAQSRWPIKQVAMVHRLGRVDPTEASVGVAVSSPHRSEAFEAAKWLIDELKHEVPIWKQEHYVQNGKEWIHPTSGNCSCDSTAHKTSQAQQQSQQ